MGELLAFAGVAALVIVVPGQDTALLLRNTISGGRAAGIRTAMGVVIGIAVWALAAAAGLAALITASEPAFQAIRAIGALYLLVLGLQAFRASVRGYRVVCNAQSPDTSRPLRQGLFSNLANPKIAVFFTSLLPQFGDSFGELLGLGFLFCGMGLAWLCAYAVVMARVGDWLRRPRVRRLLDALTGTVLIGLGVRLANVSRPA